MPERSVLFLIRHSMPETDPSRSASAWPLSAEGRTRARQFAASLKRYGLQALASSEELKAVQTATILGKELHLTVDVVPGLHEHERGNAAGLDQDAFLRGVARMFAQPTECVFGTESADEARERFSRALHRLLACYPGRSLGVVAHGTVLSLYVAGREGSDPYALWRCLGLPCALVLSRPGLRLIELVGGVADPCPSG